MDKARNLAAARKQMGKLERLGVVKENTDWHWTLFLSDGRRVEVYPSTNGFIFAGKKYAGDIPAICRFVSNWSVPARVMRHAV